VRRNVLEELVDGHDLVLPAHRLAADGLEAWAEVLERGYEGLVGKDEVSPYVEGRDALLAQGEGAALPRGRARVGTEEGTISSS
jgi:ATP-dependent DNA ligase